MRSDVEAQPDFEASLDVLAGYRTAGVTDLKVWSNTFVTHHDHAHARIDALGKCWLARSAAAT